jgi:hypothetical protein
VSEIYLHRLPYEPLHFVRCRRRSYVFALDYLTPAAERTNRRLREMKHQTRLERRRVRRWLHAVAERWRLWRAAR